MADNCQEKVLVPSSGWGMLALLLAGLSLAIVGFITTIALKIPVMLIFVLPLGLLCVVTLFGCMAVQPNDARVLLLFGEYKGTVSTSGFYWVNPFYSKKRISLRIRNFETGSTSVNEK